MLVGFSATMYGLLRDAVERQTDASLVDMAEAVRTSLLAEAGEEASDSSAIAGTLDAFRFRDVGVAVAGGGLLVAARPQASRKHRWALRGAVTTARRGVPRHPVWATVPDHEGGVRTYATPVELRSHRYTIVVGQSLHDVTELGEDALGLLGVAIPVALLLAGLGGWFLATRSLAPVVLMSDRAAQIGAENARDRLPVANAGDELGHLASVFNALLERLGSALEQQRRFMADASHELRTPVAIVRAEADVSLSRETRDEGEYREALQVVRVEAGRLSVLVDDLFLLARADAGEYPLRPTEVYLEELVLEEARAVRALAERRGITLQCDVPEEALYRGDEDLLRRMLRNLVDNAIKHGPAGEPVTLGLRAVPDGYLLTVCDRGPGIPAEARERVFERFFRADAARSRREGGVAPGAGLGLSIARWIAESHGGTVALAGSEPGAGTEFRVWLPWDLRSREGR